MSRLNSCIRSNCSVSLKSINSSEQCQIVFVSGPLLLDYCFHCFFDCFKPS
jgi:hypothetical protein